MNAEIIEKNILSINFLNVQAYLKSTGWDRIQSRRENMAIFHSMKNGKANEILLPLDRGYADYKKAIERTINIIADFESRPFNQILFDLLIPLSDVIRFRVISDDTKIGTISFADGFSLFESARTALYASACDVIQPENYHKRLSFKQADLFIENCRLGQTEQGSYIATIICPFVKEKYDEEKPTLTLFSDKEEKYSSFTRKVTKHLMKSLYDVTNAITDDNYNDIIKSDREDKISANLLDAIVNFTGLQEGGNIEILSTWASVIPPKDNIVNKVMITNDYIAPIEKIIATYTPNDIAEEGEFVGRISQVKAEPDIKKRTEGEIYINFISEKENAIKAKVILGLAEYEKACEAHEKGLNVKIKGKLKSSGRTKIIEDPSFEII